MAAIGMLTLASMVACGSDEIAGVEQPLDGSWELLGLFTDFDDQVRCWLTGEVDLSLVGGGFNTMNGTGRHVLECDAGGDIEIVEGMSVIQAGRYIGEEVQMQFGFCGFVGTYVPSQPQIIKGHATCNISTSLTGRVGIVGSWEAVRVINP